MGPGMILKVMAGDIVNAQAKYFYYQNDPTGGTNNPVADVLQSLVGAFPGIGVSGLAKANGTQIYNSLSAPGAFSTFIQTSQPTTGNTAAPKAYLSVVFLDEQFTFVEPDAATPGEGTSSRRVSSANDANAVFAPLQQKAPKNGWVFVYLSNQSNETVYFDDLYVSQEHSAISEESHYYPHGLKIAGISSRAFNKLDNKYGYQGDYSDEEAETGWNEFDLRSYDPQIGRWTGLDPYDEFASPYIGMGNDPVNHVDPDGGFSLNLGMLGQITGSVLGDRLLAAGAGALVGFGIDKSAGGKGGIGAVLGAGIGFAGTFIPPVDLQGIGTFLSDGFYKLNSLLPSVDKLLDQTLLNESYNTFVTIVIFHGIDESKYDASAGGRAGGHVMINFGDDNLYGFTGWGIKKGSPPSGQVPDYKEVPLFPSRNQEGEKWFSSIHGSEYHGGMSLINSGYRLENGEKIPVGVVTKFRIPATQEQYDGIRKWYESTVNTSPYPYTQFGMRCTSSIYSSLKRFGIIQNNLPLNSTTNAFGPGFLFRYLWNSGYNHSSIINSSGINKNKINFYGR